MTTTAFWGMVINNYDDTDLALVQQGYPDFVRQIVYTLERGEQGTPHIQGYIKLYRQQRLSYVKRLFPRGNFRALTSEEYKLNAQRYAQKLDATAESPAVISNNPFPDPVVELVSVIEEAFSSSETNEYWYNRPSLWSQGQPETHILLEWLRVVEFKRVRKHPRLAKFYVSPMYRNIKKEYLDALKAHVFDLQNTETHTHTHTGEIISPSEGITNIHAPQVRFEEQESQDDGTEGEDDEGDFYSSGEESEAADSCDDSGCSERSSESEDGD